MKVPYLLVFLVVVVVSGMTPVSAVPFEDAPLKLEKGSETVAEFRAEPVIKEIPGFRVRVAGYNIAHARGEETGGFNEIGKPSKLKGIAQLIRNNRIDIVGFTEIL